MKIVYLGRHRPGDWDEGSAISYALTQLGHEVTKVAERDIYDCPRMTGYDFLLFNHWGDFGTLDRFEMPKVFWNFDLVEWPSDPSLAIRCAARVEWMRKATEIVKVGFCSDGDWVDKDATGKLVQLREGADERYCGMGDPLPNIACDVLFVGSPNGGRQRRSWDREVKGVYGARYLNVGNKNANCVWTRPLADLIASVPVVLAPDNPVTERYWSNRIYVMLGFGAFLVHPYTKELAATFEDRRDVVFYRDREEMFSLVNAYLRRPSSHRQRVAESGLKKVLAAHTFRHRCEFLIKTVKERL